MFGAVLEALSPSTTSYHSSLDAFAQHDASYLGKSRVREICMPGSVRAKAKWLSYSTNSRSSPEGRTANELAQFSESEPKLSFRDFGPF